MSNTIYSTFRRWQVAAFVFLVLFLARATGIEAQDVTPPADTTVVNNLVAVQWAIIGVLSVGLIVLFLYFSDKLYKALPPEAAGVVRESQKAALDLALKFLEQKKTEASANDVDWDDGIWQVVFDEAKKRRELLNDDPLKAQRGVG